MAQRSIPLIELSISCLSQQQREDDSLMLFIFNTDCDGDTTTTQLSSQQQHTNTAIDNVVNKTESTTSNQSKIMWPLTLTSCLFNAFSHVSCHGNGYFILIINSVIDVVLKHKMNEKDIFLDDLSLDLQLPFHSLERPLILALVPSALQD